MFNYTQIGRLALVPQAKKALREANDCEKNQRLLLQQLLKFGVRTKFGQLYGMNQDFSYEQFASNIPIQSYEAFRPYVMRMIAGESDVLWPGKTKRFAQSSGTSGGKSKYIPITKESLRVNHYGGAAVSVGLYLNAYPESRMFGGKGLILGGSFANELSLPHDVKVGDLSANLIDAINPLVNLVRVPNKKIALMANWKDKLPAIVSASIKQDITNLSGVPSWFLRVLQLTLEKTGKTCIQEIWPHLEVFFHGGIAFGPYRSEYDKIMAPTMRYWETYNASEGFFASQMAPNEHGMLLIPNIGIFYEFLPLDEINQDCPKSIPIWKAEKGETYALIITAPNGLWRYAIGDTVTVIDTNPLKIVIAGRTNSFINAFGEEVMECNTDAALAFACEKCQCTILNYTVAPIYTKNGKKGRHQWLIEWDKAPADIPEFAKCLDKALQNENSDYQAKRSDNIFLDSLEVLAAPKGAFDRWLASTGKLGGQRKIPRLSNDRSIIDSILNS